MSNNTPTTPPNPPNRAEPSYGAPAKVWYPKPDEAPSTIETPTPAGPTRAARSHPTYIIRFGDPKDEFSSNENQSPAQDVELNEPIGQKLKTPNHVGSGGGGSSGCGNPSSKNKDLCNKEGSVQDTKREKTAELVTRGRQRGQDIERTQSAQHAQWDN